jgi:hypothetical protein
VGSHVNLTCIVQFSPEPPEYVFWHHHDQVRTKKKKCCLPSIIVTFLFDFEKYFFGGHFSNVENLCQNS